MAIQDRIKEFIRVPASELKPNPKNWRSHPPEQQRAIQSILEEVGYADALIAYETDQGLTLIDGHLRVDTTPDETVPVLVLDVTEEEADKILATLDPVASMAGADDELLHGLLDSINAEEPDLKEFLSQIRTGMTPGFEPLGEWNPELDATRGINPTDTGIEARIIVRCPQESVSEVKPLIQAIMSDYPEVTID